MFNTDWTRRSFLQRSAIGAGAVISGDAALQLLTSGRAWAASGGDVDVLNFALTLEYLEATFYEKVNSSGVITDPSEQDAFKLIQTDEEAHVQAISQTISKIGGQPVAKPSIHFPSAAFQSRDSILKTSKAFEETGVGAYLGQAGNIQSKDILQAAAGIFGVECRHAALVGVIAGLPPEGGVYMGATETAKDKNAVLAAVMPFLASQPASGFAPQSSAPNLLPAGLGALGGAALALAGLRMRGQRPVPERDKS